MEAKTNKAITTQGVNLPAAGQRTRAWDPGDMITTGNVEQIRAANARGAIQPSPDPTVKAPDLEVVQEGYSPTREAKTRKRVGTNRGSKP